jgi:hypothetical protein
VARAPRPETGVFARSEEPDRGDARGDRHMHRAGIVADEEPAALQDGGISRIWYARPGSRFFRRSGRRRSGREGFLGFPGQNQNPAPAFPAATAPIR